MNIDELDYDLPAERVATRPAEPRDAARLLVVRRGDESLEHRCVRDLPELLAPGDALVFNTTSVLPARLVARRHTGGRIDGLALHPAPDAGDGAWRVLLRGAARLHAGERLALVPATGTKRGDFIELIGRDDEAWLARF